MTMTVVDLPTSGLWEVRCTADVRNGLSDREAGELA
jgi:hypothetical protein